MTDPQQAARIAAMRARRGQAPVEIPVVTDRRPAADHAPFVRDTHSPNSSSMGWAPPVPPAAAAAQPMATPHTVTDDTIEALRKEVRQLRQQVQQTQRTTAPKPKHPHVAAGARILATGLTASAVFGLTAVIADASRPAASTTPVDPAATTPVVQAATPAAGVVDPNAAAVTTTLPVAGTIPLTIPPLDVPTTAAVPAAATPQAAAPAPAKPATTQPKAATPAPAPAPATTQPPAPVATQPPAPVTTTKPSGK